MTIRQAAAAVALLAAAVACDDGTDPDPDPERGTLEVEVRADAAPRSGVGVDLFASGSSTALDTETTGSTGIATFGDLDAGAYEVGVEVPTGLVLAEGEPERVQATVVAGSVERVTVDLLTDPGVEVVEIQLTTDLSFDPSEVTIAPGTTVRWVNAASIFHTVTPDGHSEWARAELSQQGETFEHTFEDAGTFDYFCEPHQSAGMVGTITVQ